MKRAVAVVALISLLAGCASPRPKFYPNAYYKDVGETQAQKDADECLAKAKAYVKSNPVKPIAKSTAWGAFTGALMGIVIGAITGNPRAVIESGAAAGGVGGAVSGTYESTQPDALVRAYTDRCLAEKGYSILGWR